MSDELASIGIGKETPFPPEVQAALDAEAARRAERFAIVGRIAQSHEETIDGVTYTVVDKVEVDHVEGLPDPGIFPYSRIRLRPPAGRPFKMIGRADV